MENDMHILALQNSLTHSHKDETIKDCNLCVEGSSALATWNLLFNLQIRCSHAHSRTHTRREGGGAVMVAKSSLYQRQGQLISSTRAQFVSSNILHLYRLGGRGLELSFGEKGNILISAATEKDSFSCFFGFDSSKK